MKEKERGQSVEERIMDNLRKGRTTKSRRRKRIKTRGGRKGSNPSCTGILLIRIIPVTKLSSHEARILRRRARLLRNEVLEELGGQAYQVGVY